jgi:NAD(P)-dependent dehydrogenase (short-subunit alcohol dehydrogenase family)
MPRLAGKIALVTGAASGIGLNVLDNNAVITGFEDWHAVLATNLDGVFPSRKHAIRAMRLHGTDGGLLAGTAAPLRPVG